MLGPVEQVLVFLSMFVLMVGMGSTMGIDDLKRLLKKPITVAVGCSIQFLVMPFLAYWVGRTLALTPGEALALLMVGCSPGGAASNMYAWFSKGHVPLSVAMTLVSTLAAVVLMPLLIQFYGQQADLEVVLPIQKIALSMAFVLIPIGIGVLLKQRSFAYLQGLQRSGAVLGIVATSVMLVSWVPRLWQEFLTRDSNAYLAIFLLGNFGFICGYAWPRILGFSAGTCRTMSIETGLQNTLLTFTVMSLSFPPEFVSEVGWIPLLYGAGVVGLGMVYVGLFRWLHHRELSLPPRQPSDPDPWERFVLRHNHPLNLKIHLLSFAMFWGGPLLALWFWDWRWLALLSASGPMGAFGHWVSKDSQVSLHEATSSWDAIRFSSKMCLLIIAGKYSQVQQRVHTKFANPSTGLEGGVHV